jgi:hypothetical protein
MSIYVLSWVFKNSETTKSDRLVLLALADYAEDDGSKAFPSIATLSEKARTKERTTEEALARLRDAGAIEATSRTASGIVVYRVLMDENAAALGGARDSRGAKTRKATPRKTVGDPAKTRDAHTKEPSTTRQENRVERSAPDVNEAPLAHLLADLIAANDPDGKRPTVSRAWALEEDRLKRIDGRAPEQIEFVIRWVQADGFESCNVLSMPKLRKRYGELVRKAMKKKPTGGSAASQADDRIKQLDALQRRLEEEEGKR